MNQKFEACHIIRSIPGIGGKIATTIISEIGEIDQFLITQRHS
ncbi:transposase [Chengkuizengella sediminis]|nr:transposase [Chengkuizengella sediminis]NDI36292.1 IS110 family transposase [Chengkuizengella sediminis]